MNSRSTPEPAVPVGYGDLFEQVKSEVQAARVRAARVVNVEVIDLYWRIGRLILDRRNSEGWGSRVVERLSADLRAEFPGMRGLAPRSLEYMQTFASAWPEPIAQQPVARLPWGHITVLLDRLDDNQVRQWYAAQDVHLSGPGGCCVITSTAVVTCGLAPRTPLGKGPTELYPANGQTAATSDACGPLAPWLTV